VIEGMVDDRLSGPTDPACPGQPPARCPRHPE